MISDKCTNLCDSFYNDFELEREKKHQITQSLEPSSMQYPQPPLPLRIVTKPCGRAQLRRRILPFRICGFCVDFSSCHVQSFQSFWPFGSIDTMFLTTWLFHHSEPKVGLVIRDFFLIIIFSKFSGKQILIEMWRKNPLKPSFKSRNVRLCPDEYRRHRGRGRQRRRSFLYDWIVSRAMGTLFKADSEYFLGVLSLIFLTEILKPYFKSL